MIVNNRIIEKEDLTFFQWLNIYESITKKEFRQLKEHEQKVYIRKFELFKKKYSI